MRIAASSAILCLVSGACFAQPIQQSTATITPGHPLVWVTNGVAGDGGESTNGSLTSIGITGVGTPLGINDQSVTSPGGFHGLYLGANSAGGGLISYGSFGGASTLPMSLSVNGSTVLTADGSIATANGNWHFTGSTTIDSLSLSSINNTPIGNITPSTGAFTTIAASGAASLLGGGTHAGTFTGGTFSGITLGGSITGTGATITGGTFSGATWSAGTFSGNQLGTLNLTGAGTALSVTNNATVGGTVTLGSGNQITLTPGATGATGATISSSGSGGLVLAGSPQTNNFQVGRQNNFAWSGSTLLTALMPLFSTSSLSGSSSNNFVADNYIVVNGDTLAYSGANTVEGLRVSHNFGGTGTTGARTSITALLTQTAANSDGAPGNIGVWSDVVTSFNNGGNGSTYAGSWWGFNSISQLNTGATFQSQLIGYEADMVVKTGASVADRVGITVNSSSAADLVQGILTDAAYAIAQNPLNSYPGWTNGFQLGGHGGAFPLDATKGCVVCIAPQVDWTVTPSAAFKSIKAAYGIDLHQLETVNYSFAVPGVAIDNTGALLVGPGVISTTSTGISIDAPNYQVTAAALASNPSGTGCFANDRLYGANRGIFTVSTVNGSNGVTALTSAPLFAGVNAAAQANPVSLTGTNCRGVSTTLTWTQASTIQIGASATVNTIIGTGSALATNATAGFLQLPTMAGAPSGTVGAAGKAATVIDTTDNKLCWSTGGGIWKCVTGT